MALWLLHSSLALHISMLRPAAQMELHELRQGVLKELEAAAAAERAPEV